jgi:uncharacterized membrane protein YvbJ
MNLCVYCGHENKEDDKICVNCGCELISRISPIHGWTKLINKFKQQIFNTKKKC